ncbi:MAG TPA: dihydroorotate dehydrogenase-like protein [Bacteroidaceae bacterium]|nr:dihydroorotate dehydrogenase-like protein [Bacteroidaceae bacterium]
MIDLSTTYAGLKLKTPIIVSSSGLTNSVVRLKKIAGAGAGGAVLKSLFEEQILHETGTMSAHSDYPEAEDYLRAYARENSIDNYLKMITSARDIVDIPIIASINCVSSDEWVSFASEIEKAGASAIELNIYFLPNNKDKNPRDYENAYLDLVTKVKKKTSLPVIVKIGQGFTNITWIVNQLYLRGASAVVLFNRFYAPDFNTDTFTYGSADALSSPNDIRDSLRWVGIVSSQVKEMNIASSTGVHSGLAVIKQLLAGATAVQVCSVLYRNGIDYIRDMISEMKKWMDKNNYSTVSEFRGRMNYGNLKDPSVYERVQFMKYFSQIH